MPPSAASINRRLSNPIIHPPPNLQSIQTPVRTQRRELPAAAEPVAPGALGPPQSTPQFVSSDEEEAYFSDPTQWSDPQQVPTPVSDPNKIIIATYLMKKSRKTAREVWRKRWFYLTSGGMTYSKSHMVSRGCFAEADAIGCPSPQLCPHQHHSGCLLRRGHGRRRHR
jgi:hypothetical protein